MSVDELYKTEIATPQRNARRQVKITGSIKVRDIYK